MMKSVNLEHNLEDYELEETLEKALRGVQETIQRPERRFRDPFMETLAERSTEVFSRQITRMNEVIKQVIGE